MDRTLAAVIILMIAAIGYLSVRSTRKREARRASLISEFSSKLSVFAQGVYEQGHINQEIYEWLTKKVTRVQEDIGSYGIIAMYKPPFAAYAIRNYPILLNTLPEIARHTAHPSDIGSCLEALLRFSGSHEEYLDRLSRRARNPFSWFQEGTQALLLVPLYLLSWLGITGVSLLARASASRATRMVSGILALITPISALMTLVTGWPQFAIAVTSALSQILKR